MERAASYCFYLVGIYQATVSLDRFHLAATIKSNAPRFIIINMAIKFADNFITGICMAFNSNLVCHGSTWAK